MTPWLRRVATTVLLVVIPFGLLCLLSLPYSKAIPRLALGNSGPAHSPTQSHVEEPTSTSSPTPSATGTLTPTFTRTPSPTATRTRTALPSATPTRATERVLHVPVILQELPLSCEFAGMRMVAAALLDRAPDEEDLIACMPMDANPYLGFRGDPAAYSRFEDGSINWTDYGAYAPAVADALNRCVLEPAGSDLRAEPRRDVSYEDVANAVLDGYPVIVWVTKRGEPEATVVDASGVSITLVYGEHVWVVVGYHGDHAFEIHDPFPQKDERQSLRVQSFPNWDRFDHMAVFVTPRPPDPESRR